MKLEEVLPAMRAGRVARRGDSDNRYRINGDTLEVYDTVHKRWRPSSLALVDGWTLEPEPKVEWPKGSIQWALESRHPGCAARIFRRKWTLTDPLALADININNISPLDLLALDWEVVP